MRADIKWTSRRLEQKAEDKIDENVVGSGSRVESRWQLAGLGDLGVGGVALCHQWNWWGQDPIRWYRGRETEEVVGQRGGEPARVIKIAEVVKENR